MFFLIGGWRTKKHVKHGNQHLTQSLSLFEAHEADLNPNERIVIEGRLEYADDLKRGLGDRPRWTQIRQARAFRDCAEDTLRYIERKISPRPQIQSAPARRRFS